MNILNTDSVTYDYDYPYSIMHICKISLTLIHTLIQGTPMIQRDGKIIKGQLHSIAQTKIAETKLPDDLLSVEYICTISGKIE